MNDQTIKVIDWGLGICFANEVMQQPVGSSSYCAPEVMTCAGAKGKAYTCQCDLWSLGVLSYVMLCGKPPFWGTQKDLLKRAQAEMYPMERPPWNQITDLGKDFVCKLLKADPEKRLPINEVMAHPWLNNIGQFSNCAELVQVTTNLQQFSNHSRFQAMCVTAVAKQLDHRCLRRIHRVFRDIDTKGDGVLSFQEVAEGFKKIYGEDSKEYKNVQQTFEQMDLDGSGTIDYTEFCAAGMGQFGIKQDDAVWAAFKSFDIDDSGEITKVNLEKILSDTGVLDAWSSDVCQEVAQEILNRFARTGTNAIQYKEWKELMQSCWQERNMIAEEDGKSDEQPPLVQNFSNISVVDGEYRYTNKVEWAYEALVEANGLTPTS
jgi:calcium-dependent protein kinase